MGACGKQMLSGEDALLARKYCAVFSKSPLARFHLNKETCIFHPLRIFFPWVLKENIPSGLSFWCVYFLMLCFQDVEQYTTENMSCWYITWPCVPMCVTRFPYNKLWVWAVLNQGDKTHVHVQGDGGVPSHQSYLWTDGRQFLLIILFCGRPQICPSYFSWGFPISQQQHFEETV